MVPYHPPAAGPLNPSFASYRIFCLLSSYVCFVGEVCIDHVLSQGFVRLLNCVLALRTNPYFVLRCGTLLGVFRHTLVGILQSKS